MFTSKKQTAKHLSGKLKNVIPELCEDSTVEEVAVLLDKDLTHVLRDVREARKETRIVEEALEAEREDRHPVVMDLRKQIAHLREKADQRYVDMRNAEAEAEQLRTALENLVMARGVAGTVMVPVKPPKELLESMAVRYDVSLASPDCDGKSKAKAIALMRRLYEEATGQGYFDFPAFSERVLSGKDTGGDAPTPRERLKPVAKTKQ